MMMLAHEFVIITAMNKNELIDAVANPGGKTKKEITTIEKELVNAIADTCVFAL